MIARPPLTRAEDTVGGGAASNEAMQMGESGAHARCFPTPALHAAGYHRVVGERQRGFDVGVVGGAGHVGAPLAILMAARGLRTLIYDKNADALSTLARGELPFLEEGAEPLLRKAIADEAIGFTADPSKLSGVPIVVITIGTPIDEFHNPMLRVVTECIDELLPYLSDDQTIVLRSTVYPGVTESVAEHLRRRGCGAKVAFCPERVAQGHATKELQSLPQIVSGITPEAEDVAAQLFSRIAPKVIRVHPKEAEFTKLFSNAYRYIQFAAANQFYMMVESEGLDHRRVLSALKADYPRLRDLPSPGFAAGPCLYKDTLQLAAFANNNFALGHAAIHANEGLPAFLVRRIQERFPLSDLTVGLLGMAFKANSDDIRASLSYKLKKLLRSRARAVLTSDPYVRGDPEILTVGSLIDASDLLILCVPHAAYSGLDLRGKPVVDPWGYFGGPVIPGLSNAVGIEHIEPWATTTRERVASE